MPDLKPKMLVLSMMPALEKPTEAGLKFVLFQIKDNDVVKGYDYGFANWTGNEWEEVSPTATVVKWADIPHPKVLF